MSNLDLKRVMYILEENKDNPYFLEDQIIKIFNSNYAKILTSNLRFKLTKNQNQVLFW